MSIHRLEWCQIDLLLLMYKRLIFKLSIQNISNHPDSPVFMRVSGVFQGDKLNLKTGIQGKGLRPWAFALKSVPFDYLSIRGTESKK
jgi:hypothetical protein